MPSGEERWVGSPSLRVLWVQTIPGWDEMLGRLLLDRFFVGSFESHGAPDRGFFHSVEGDRVIS